MPGKPGEPKIVAQASLTGIMQAYLLHSLCDLCIGVDRISQLDVIIASAAINNIVNYRRRVFVGIKMSMSHFLFYIMLN